MVPILTQCSYIPWLYCCACISLVNLDLPSGDPITFQPPAIPLLETTYLTLWVCTISTPFPLISTPFPFMYECTIICGGPYSPSLSRGGGPSPLPSYSPSLTRCMGPSYSPSLSRGGGPSPLPSLCGRRC